MSRAQPLIPSFFLILQRLLVWAIAVGAALTPLLYEQYLEGETGGLAIDRAENRVAVAMSRYQTTGRLVITGTSPHRKLDLKLPVSDWPSFPSPERNALERRVASSVMNGVPIESYVIRDDAGKILAAGAGTG